MSKRESRGSRLQDALDTRMTIEDVSEVMGWSPEMVETLILGGALPFSPKIRELLLLLCDATQRAYKKAGIDQ